MEILNNEQEPIARVVNNKLLLGIGRQYSTSEKRIIHKFAKDNGYHVTTCNAGIYIKVL